MLTKTLRSKSSSFRFTRHRAALVTLIAMITIAPVGFAAEFETPTVITGGTVVVRPGEVLENATVLINDGRIVAVGSEVEAPSHSEQVDATGLWIYAGFIDATSHLGIANDPPSSEEMNRLRDTEQDVGQGPRTSMQKANRQGIWPHRSIAGLYVADNDKQEALRKAGFTTALISPPPAILGGTGDIIQLSDRPLRTATVARGLTQIVAYGGILTGREGRSRGYPSSRMGMIALMRQTFMDAAWYREGNALYAQHPTAMERVPADPVLDAMGDLLDRKPLFVFLANTAGEIHHALDLAQEFNQRIVILGGGEAWRVTDRLVAGAVPVIVSPDWKKKPRLAPKKKKDEEEDETLMTTASWEPEWEDDYYEPLSIRRERIRRWEEQVDNLRRLIEAGVTVAVTGRDAKNPGKLIENLRTAIERGLTPEQALAALTTGPASVLGMEAQLGTVSKGSLANLAVLTGPFGEKESKVRYAFVDGERFEYTVKLNGDSEDDDKDDSDGEDEGDEEDSDNEGEEEDQEEDEDPEDLHPWASESEADRRPPLLTNKNVLLKNATVLTMTNGTLNDQDVLVQNGRIAEIGRNLEVPKGVTVYDLTGYWLMPGIVDPHSHMAGSGGLNEGSQSITCEVRVGDVTNPDHLALHRALGGGVTTIHVMHGSANSIGGQNAVLKLKYRESPRDMLVSSGPRIVKFALGENVIRAQRGVRFPRTRMGVESVMRQAFNDALAYRNEWGTYEENRTTGAIVSPPRRDLRLEALNDILRGNIWVHSHCYRADEILRLLAVAEDYGFRIAALQHVLEGYRVAPEMFAHGVGGSTFSDWWAYKKEAFDAIPYNAAMMMKAGVVTSVNSDSAEVVRYLNLEAAKSMRFGGLTADQALKLITINPAIQIGLSNRIGSIEVGKDGDFAVFNGHPLDSFSRNVMTIIEGEVYFADPRIDLNALNPGPGSTFIPEPPRAPLSIEKNEGGVYALTGGTVHPIGSPSVENGVVVIDSGLVISAGRNVEVPRSATVVDVSGLHVYPGIINAASSVAMVEISGIAQTNDTGDIARFQPELRTVSAVNPHSEHIGVSLSEGITTAHLVPRRGVIAGRGGLVQLVGWSMPEMLRNGETGLVMDLPSLPGVIEGDDRGKDIEAHGKAIESIEKFIKKAQHYAKVRDMNGSGVARDIRLDAMIPYVRGEKQVYFRANAYKEILEAIRFSETFALRPVILGGADAWKCADLLKEKDIPVIVTDVLRQPQSEFDLYDMYYANAAKLEKAGVRFCIAFGDSGNVNGSTKQLPIHAGTAVAHGLSEERAIRAITLSAAEILGVADRIGSLEGGKVADVIVTTGTPLQASTRTVAAFVKGQPVELTSIHEKSFEKFTNRPDPGLKPTGELRGPPPMRAVGN